MLLVTVLVWGMMTNRPNTRILVDGGDPNETLRVKTLTKGGQHRKNGSGRVWVQREEYTSVALHKLYLSNILDSDHQITHNPL